MKDVLVLLVAVLISVIPSVNVNADQQIIMEIEGMTCKLWPLAIKKSLSATEGVENVKISYEQAKAWITVSESIENKILIDAVSKAGPFKGKVIERRTLQLKLLPIESSLLKGKILLCQNNYMINSADWVRK